MKTAEEKDWSIPVDGKIDVPDHLMPLFNKIATQLRFHTISGKEEVLTIAHILQHAEKFFRSLPIEQEQEAGLGNWESVAREYQNQRDEFKDCLKQSQQEVERLKKENLLLEMSVNDQHRSLEAKNKRIKELEAQLKETKELTHRAINCADYVHISTIREIQKELLALESSPIEQSKQLDYTHIMKPIGNREPEAQKCRACEIEKNDEQVKQKPMHTCGKDGEIEKPQRKQPII